MAAQCISEDETIRRYKESGEAHSEKFDIFIIAPTWVSKWFEHMRRHRLTKRVPSRFSGKYK